MTTMLLATSGGHLRQLKELSSRLPSDDDVVWVTTADQQSRSMLSEESDVVFVPDVRPRRPLDALSCLPLAHRLRIRKNVTRAVSTGSGIALGYLPYLAVRGVECHYIESATRVTGPSVTGRVLERVPEVRLYTQYPGWADDRWRYSGNIFDSYDVVRLSRGLGDVIRVVVTIGIATGFPFRRLLQRLVPLLAADGALSRTTGRPVEVLWQTAGTPVDDLPIEASPVVPAAELAAALAQADVVVSHAGTGSAVTALDSGRFPLLAARSARYGEIADDHQHQLADELGRRGLCLPRRPEAISIDDLLSTVSREIRTNHAPPAFALIS